LALAGKEMASVTATDTRLVRASRGQINH